MAEKTDELLHDEIETPEEIVLANLLTELGGVDDVTVSVYRTGAGYHAKQQYIAEMLPEEFSLELLRDKYKGGDFRIHVKQNGRLKANKSVSVEKQEVKTNADLIADLMAVNNPPQSMEGLDRLADAMTNGFTQMQNIMIQMQADKTPPLPPVDPAAQMQGMMTMLVSMKEFLGGGPKLDPMDGILKGIELAKEIGGSDGEANTFDVLKESIKTFGKPIAEMASKMNGGAMPQTAPITYLPAGAKPEQVFRPQQPPQNEADMIKAMIKHQINMLLKQAKKGSDPGLYADLILDQLPEDKIKLFLGSEDWFKKIIELVPEVQDHQQWFTELRDFVMDALTPEEVETIPNVQAGKTPPIMMQAAGLEPYDEYNDETGSGNGNDP